MTRAEIYKITAHRTPRVCAAVLLIGVLIPSVVLVWYTPADPAAYTTNFTDSYDVFSIMLGIVFGGWLLGTEFRQDTVKRLLSSEPRRMRALATKGLVGAGALSTVLAAIGTIGWVAARIVGSMNDVTVPWQGRVLLASALTSLVASATAYSLSAITRSDAFAMVGTLSLILLIEPLLSEVPGIGRYTLGSALDHLGQSISGQQLLPTVELSTGMALLVLATWLSTLIQLGATLFARRDV